MENNAEALRSILFAALHSIGDKTTEVDMDRAKATSMIAKDIISLAKLEAHHAKDNGGSSKFLGVTPAQVSLPTGITGIQQHRIK
jgi:hypothetical protein